MGVKEFVTKTLTTGGIVGLGYYTFIATDILADALHISDSGLDKLIGILGEEGVEGGLRYGVPLVAIYFYRIGAERLEERAW